MVNTCKSISAVNHINREKFYDCIKGCQNINGFLWKSTILVDRLGKTLLNLINNISVKMQ